MLNKFIYAFTGSHLFVLFTFEWAAETPEGGRGGEVKQRDIQIGIVKLVCIFFGCVCVMENATGMTDRKLKNMISVAETEKN